LALRSLPSFLPLWLSLRKPCAHSNPRGMTMRLTAIVGVLAFGGLVASAAFAPGPSGAHLKSAQPWNQPGYYPDPKFGGAGSPGYNAEWERLHPDNPIIAAIGYASDGSPMAPPSALTMAAMLPRGAVPTGDMTVSENQDATATDGPNVPGHQWFGQNYTLNGQSRHYSVLAEGPFKTQQEAQGYKAGAPIAPEVNLPSSTASPGGARGVRRGGGSAGR
jgi:hypothetical protein